MSTADYIYEDRLWQQSPINNENVCTTQDTIITEESIRKGNTSIITYEKGGSAGSQGVKFQVSLLVVSLLNAFRGLSDWRLSTENKKAGKFDDMVLEWPSGSILLQAKHRENKTKRITFEELFSVNPKSDEFSLPKYFLSYHQEIKKAFKIKNVIICTNVSLNDKILKYVNSQKVDTESMLYFEGNDCLFYTFKEEILPYLKETAKSYLEKNLKSKDPIFTDEDLLNFLETLQFYFDYPGKNNFEEVINQILSNINLHRQISPLDVFGTVMDWFQQKRGVYFTATYTKGMFLEIWRNKYWQTLDHYNVQFRRNDFNIQQSENLLYKISKNSYFLLELQVYNGLKSNKANILYVTFNDGVDILEQAIEAFELPQYTILIIIWPKFPEKLIKWDRLKQILVQHNYKQVIIVSENSKVYHEMGLDENSYDVVTESMTFEDLSENTQERLLKMKNIVFQGTEINLEELFRPVTSAEYDKLIDLVSLETLIKGEKIKVGAFPLVLDQNISSFYVYRLFKGNEDETLETINEERILQVNAKIILISGVAGMGKSTVLSNLAVIIKKNYPNLWVIRIELSHYTAVLNNTLQNNKTVISIKELLNSKQTTEFTNALEKSVFSLGRKVVLMLDGLDEISPDYTELILDLLGECQEASNFAKIFVTTRPHMTELVGKKLGAKTFTLQPFTESNQIRFFINYWTHNLKLTDVFEEKCQQYARALVRKVMAWITADHHFAEIPLQARMLAEIFQQNDQLQASADFEGCKKFLSTNSAEPEIPERMDMLMKFYETFFEEKRKVFVNKGNPSGNVMANKALNHQFKECFSYSRNLALEMILGKCKCRHFSNYRKGDKNLEEISLKIGIVQTTNDELQFVHRTFAEYLVGESIVMELQLPNKSEDFQRVLFGEILLDMQYMAVRTFVESFLQKSGASRNTNFQLTINDQNVENVHYKSYWIHLLAKEGLPEVLRLLLQYPDFKIVRDESIPEVDGKKSRPRLIEIGGVDTEDENGRTPLHLAARHNHLKMVKFLVERGANVNSYHKIYGPPLASAIVHGHFKVVKFLVEQGADIRAKNGIDGVPIMYKAIISKHSTIITYFLETVLKDMPSDVNDAMTAYCAAYLGRLNILEEFISRGLNVNDDVVNGETLIFAASRGGQLDTIKYLVQKGGNINITNKWKKTALHVISVEPSAVPTALLLIEMGIDLNAVDNEYRTARYIALACGNVDVTNLLIRKGAILNVRRASTRSTYTLAERYRGNTVLRWLQCAAPCSSQSYFVAKYGSSKDSIPIQDMTSCAPAWSECDIHGNLTGIFISDNNGHTKIHQSVSDLRWDTIERLLEYGADVNAADNQGRTIIHEAALGGYLLELFQIGLNDEVLDVNAQDNDGRTALHLCALENQRRMLEFLLEHEADANIKDNDGCTALHLSALDNHLGVVEVLVGHDVNINIVDNDGCTALHLCAWENQKEVLKFLLKHGANPIIKNNYGYTAFHLSVLKNDLDVVELFVEHGVNINITDNNGCTALHLCAWKSQRRMLEFLLKHGADPNVKNNNGYTASHMCATVEHGMDINTTGNKGCTALHLCAWEDDREMLEFLLEHGADANMRDDYGYTALHVSALKNHLDIVEVLVEHGVDINAIDNRGCTALDLCSPKARRKMIKLLAKYEDITNNNGLKGNCLLL